MSCWVLGVVNKTSKMNFANNRLTNLRIFYTNLGVIGVNGVIGVSGVIGVIWVTGLNSGIS